MKKAIQPSQRKPIMTQPQKTAIIRVKELAARLSVSTATIWNMTNPNSRHYNPDFPRPVKVSANITGWLENEIAAYLAECAAKRDSSARPEKTARTA